MQAARRVGAAITTRARLLADLFNEAPMGVGVAGTSGKSTTVGMIGWILHRAGKSPTIMNGADMKNFVADDSPVASARIGEGEIFVSEVDESDGSIAFFEPRIAIVNNISLDHKSLDELRSLFRDFSAKAETVVLNLDNPETAALVPDLKPGQAMTYSLTDTRADLLASSPAPSPAGIAFRVRARDTGEAVEIKLQVPGLHNIANALAALCAAKACGVPLADAAGYLGEFSGIRRRLEVVGTVNGVTVIDDFAHNPDKISATLETMHAFPGRLLLMFQPHGYGPIRLMKDALVDCFANSLHGDDVLLMPSPSISAARSIAALAAGKSFAKSSGAVEKPSRCRIAMLAAIAWSSWPVLAIASWSWGPATIRFRYSRMNCCDGLRLRARHHRSSRFQNNAVSHSLPSGNIA